MSYSPQIVFCSYFIEECGLVTKLRTELQRDSYLLRVSNLRLVVAKIPLHDSNYLMTIQVRHIYDQSVKI